MAIEKLFKAVVGVLLILTGLYLLTFWWGSFLVVLKAGIPPLVILIGLLFILLSTE